MYQIIYKGVIMGVKLHFFSLSLLCGFQKLVEAFGLWHENIF